MVASIINLDKAAKSPYKPLIQRTLNLRKSLRDICLSEGSAGVSQRALQGLSEGSAGSLWGSVGSTGFSEVFQG